MKLILALSLFFAGNLHSLAQADSGDQPCAAIYIFNSSFLAEALDLYPNHNNAEIVSATLDRQTATQAEIVLSYKDGSSLKLDAKVACESADLIIQPHVETYVCKSYVDCMPILGQSSEEAAERAKYCSQEYKAWAKKNCGGEPMVVF